MNTADRDRPESELWLGIDELLADIARMVRGGLCPEPFAHQFVVRLARSLTHGRIAIWDAVPFSAPRVLCEQAVGVFAEPDSAVHFELRQIAVQHALARSFDSPELTQATSDQSGWSGAIRLGDIDFVGDQGEVIRRDLVLELSLHDAGETLRRWSAEVLRSLAEIAGEFYRNWRLSRLAERESLQCLLLERIPGWQAEPDLDRLGGRIVEDLRHLTGADRVTLLECEAGGCRIVAVTGTAALNRREGVPRAMERLAEAVIVTGAMAGWTWEQRDPATAAGSGSPAGEFFDAAGSRWLVFAPLQIPGSVVGCVLVEGFSAAEGAAVRLVLRWSATAICTSLTMARRLRQIPGSRWWLSAGWQRATARGNRWKWWLAAGTVLAGACCCPVQFEIEARGELQPLHCREVFAPRDARVTQLHVEHGELVAEGARLLQLRSESLELEQERVWGELETVRKRLSASEAARTGERPERPSRSSGDEAAIRRQLLSLQQQFQLLQTQQAMLLVRSPIAGRVQTWNVAELLEGRPVTRGQGLLTIADIEGPWILDLRVANSRAGHVVEAARIAGRGLPVRYVLAIDPARGRDSTVRQISSALEKEPGEEPFLRLTVDVPAGELQAPRAGTGVTARIDCGRRPLVYAWLHEVIDTLWGWLAL